MLLLRAAAVEAALPSTRKQQRRGCCLNGAACRWHLVLLPLLPELLQAWLLRAAWVSACLLLLLLC